MTEATKAVVAGTVTLKHPIEFAKQEIAEIQFRRPKAKDLRDVPMEPRLGDFITIAERTALDVPAGAIGELDAEDLMEVADLVGGFFGSGPATGGS